MENNIIKLSNELTYRAYIMNRDQIWKHLSGLSMREYIALHRITELGRSAEIYSGRIYLKELAESMRLSIRQTSKMAGGLRDRGLVSWSHDGNGSDGTYLAITESGQELLHKNEELLKDYYGRVIEKFGKENLIQLLQMMKQLDTVMESELEEAKEGEADDDGRE